MISLMMRTTVCGVSLLMILRVMRIQTVMATRMISVKYAVRSGITLNAPRPAVTSIAIERMILIAFIRTPPLINIFVYRYYTTILIKWKTFLLISLRTFAKIQDNEKVIRKKSENSVQNL